MEQLSNDGPIARYFAAEKRGAAAFLAVGFTALVAGGTLAIAALLWRPPLAWRGMVPPLAVFGLIEVVVGGIVFLRTDGQVAALRAALAADAQHAREAELSRLHRVLLSFRIYKAIELAVLTAGITLILLFPRAHALYAAGLGGVLQASALLILDRAAERRAQAYAAALRGAVTSSMPGSGPA